MESSSSAVNKQKLIQEAEKLFKEAASILICNWSDMNYAIDQGLSTKNRKLNIDDEKEIEKLKTLVSYIKGERKSDLALRGELITMMEDLCVAEDIELEDFEDCLLDFMDLKFNMCIEDNSAKEIGAALMKIRSQLIQSVNNKGTLESEELQKLREFNESKNEARRKREEREREIERESAARTGDTSSSDDEEEGDEEIKKEEEDIPKLVQPTKKEPVVDADGFEMVTEKKGRRK